MTVDQRILTRPLVTAEEAAEVERLTRLNLDDMLESLGLDRPRILGRIVEPACRPAARRFARQIAEFDHRIGREGLRAASEWLLKENVASVETAGAGSLPGGPLLLAANHPGMSDTLALFAVIDRPDLRIVAADKPFLRALPNAGRHLIFLPENESARTRTLRAIVSHLRGGGAVLIFPAGEIEPDPALSPEAAEAADHWSNSIGLIARMAPSAKIVPVVISGVLCGAAQNNPLTRLRRAARDRARLGALLQIAIRSYRNVAVRVAFGEPTSAASLIEAFESTERITGHVRAAARRLIESPPRHWEARLKEART